jgi:RHS repeat-associated protein
LYQYNGKELIQDAGLGWHAYGKRYYDAAVGRFPNVDPLIDTFHFVTGYNYAENEPVGHIDLWGLQKVSANYRISLGAQVQVPLNPAKISPVSGSLDLMSTTVSQGGGSYDFVTGEVKSQPSGSGYSTEDKTLQVHQGAELTLGPLKAKQDRTFTAYTSGGGSSDVQDSSEAGVAASKNAGSFFIGFKTNDKGQEEFIIKISIDFKVVLGIEIDAEYSQPVK